MLELIEANNATLNGCFSSIILPYEIVFPAY